MLKAYKYRIFPNQEQKQQLAQTFGNVRFIYNLALETKISAYLGTKKNVNYFSLANQLKELKENPSTKWLKESPSQALQMSLRNLDNAYARFFIKKADFPKYK